MTVKQPFPAEAIPDLYQWLTSCPAIARAPEFPSDWPTFEMQMRERLARVRSWGVYTDDGSLSGAVILEPYGTRAVQAYVASARWAYGKGYLDKAARQVMASAFDSPDCDYIFGIVKERNRAACGFNRRVGMRLKNVFPEAELRVYEITRDEWAASQPRPESSH